jgi:GT2 family glycosyltransferase
VLTSYLKGKGTAATVESLGPYQRPLFPLPLDPPLVSIIVPTRDRVDLLRECLDSVRQRTDYPRFEVLVVDNDSVDPETLAYLDGQSAPVRVLKYGGAFNHSAINNYAASQAAGEVLVLLNNDTTVVRSGWLTDMVRLVLRPDVGIVGAKLRYPDGSLQHAGVIIGINGVAGHAFAGVPADHEGYFGRALVTHEYSAVTGACLAIKRSVYRDVAGLDERAFPVNFNDVDLCLRVRARGLKVLYCAAAELVHHESASRRNGDAPVQGIPGEGPRFRARWPAEFADDPCYNPNLSLSHSFELAVPPRGRAWIAYGSRPRPVPGSE